ncbi:MAG: type II secretion system F family protein [Patescibacteria group bacterium]
MKFKVTAITKDGEKYTDIVEFPDRFAVYRDIRDRGDRVTDLKEETGKGFSFLSSFADFFQGISLDEKVVLTRNLAAMLEAGLTISRALDVMKRQTRNQRLQKVLAAIISGVKSGETLSNVLASFPHIFSQLLISMVRAGEESGKLTESLRVASLQMERSSNLQKKVKGALIYPSIVLGAMVGIGALMLVFVVPTLAQTFKELNVSLPATTKFILAVSDALTMHPILSFGGIALLVGFLIAAARTEVGKNTLDFIILKIPIINTLVIEINVARTTRTLASLFSSGVDMVLSIKITRDVLDNVQYKKVLTEAEASLTQGSSLSVSFAKHTDLYPPLVAEIIAVGEETGKLSGLLKEAAEFYEESVERQTKDLSTIIEPFLMLIIGSMVGFFALSMIAPIYSLSNSI